MVGAGRTGSSSIAEAVIGPPHLARFVFSPILSGSSPRMGRSERPYFRVPPLGRPPNRCLRTTTKRYRRGRFDTCGLFVGTFYRKVCEISVSRWSHFRLLQVVCKETQPGNLPAKYTYMLLLLFLTFSALVADPKKNTLHGGQSRSWSAQQGKKKKNVWQPPPPPPSRTLLDRRTLKSKSLDASTCLGAAQVGITQVSVRLASVQGFLRLVG